MTNDIIEKFIEKKVKKHARVNIHFKQRSTVKGVFLQTADYEELKSKTSGVLLQKVIMRSGNEPAIPTWPGSLTVLNLPDYLKPNKPLKQ